MYFCTIPPDVISYIDYITYRIFVNLRGGPQKQQSYQIFCPVFCNPHTKPISYLIKIKFSILLKK